MITLGIIHKWAWLARFYRSKGTSEWNVAFSARVPVPEPCTCTSAWFSSRSHAVQTFYETCTCLRCDFSTEGAQTSYETCMCVRSDFFHGRYANCILPLLITNWERFLYWTIYINCPKASELIEVMHATSHERLPHERLLFLRNGTSVIHNLPGTPLQTVSCYLP